MSPFDYGSLIRQGQAIVPDYAAERLSQQQMQVQQAQVEVARGQLSARMAEAQKQLDDENRFRADLEDVMTNPTTEGYTRLILRNPQYAEQIKSGWGMQDEAKKRADLSVMGGIFSAGMSGRYDVAAAAMRRRIEADRAADGVVDPQDQAILDGLESQDEVQRKAALGMVGGVLAAISGPEKFAQAYKEILPSPERTVVGPGADLVDERTGQVIYSSPYRPETITDPATGQVFRIVPDEPRAPSAPQGGGSPSPSAPASGEVNIVVPPGAQQTSGFRTPEKNAEVGGVANSYHMRKDRRGNPMARDFVPAPGQSMASLAAELTRLNPGMEVINEGDHVHVEPKAGGRPSKPSGPVRVRSVQEYRKLAPGQEYIAPDGSVRTKI